MLKMLKPATISPPALAAFALLAGLPARGSARLPNRVWLSNARVDTRIDLIVFCLISALGLLVSGLFSALGLGPEISLAMAAG